MKRYNKSDIEFVDVINSGTSAAFIGKNKITGKKGIYKQNGCMLGITNEDVREKLASQIISKVGIECAQIDLVYDIEVKRNACFSNYIINDDEKLVEPKMNHNINDKNDKIENFVESYVAGVKDILNKEKFLSQCRDNVYNYIYMSCILDSYDIKSDNLPIIQNVKTNEFKVCPWFDFGVAFKEEAIQKKRIFLELSTDSILNTLFANHYDKIETLSNKVSEVLTQDNVEELFNQGYVQEAFEKEEFEKIKDRLKTQINKSNELRKEKILKLESNKNEKNRLSSMFDKLKQRILGLKNIFSGQKSLPAFNENKVIQHYKNNIDENKELCKDCTDLVKDIDKIVNCNSEIVNNAVQVEKDDIEK